jgi:hypothetical protein
VNRSKAALLAGAAAGLLGVSCLRATTLLPIPDEELKARARVVLEGVVVRVEVRRSRRGFPETWSTVRPERVFKGPFRGDLVLRDRGGELPDGSGLEVFGRPDYVVGRRILVFAVPHPEGEWQTAEFTLGKFEVWRDRAGRRYLARDLLTRSTTGVEFLRSPGSPAPAADTLRDYRAFVRMLRSRTGRDVETSAGPAAGLQPEEAAGHPGLRPSWAQWNASVLYRWNNGATASWVQSSTPSAIPGGGYAEARAALTEWSDHPTSTINYTDGGIGASGTNFIMLAAQDTCGAIGPFCGNGVIGCGGPFYSGSHVWRSETYRTVVSGHVEIRALTASDCVSSDTFASTLTHELGHTLGFGHADTGTTSVHDVCRGDEDDAQMRSFVQQRGTSLGTDDSDAARWVYGDGGNSCAGGPTPTFTPTNTPTRTPTRTPTPPPPTATRTPTPTRTATPLPPTATRTPTPTLTPTSSPPTPTLTATPPPSTPTPTPTGAPPSPTATRTPTSPGPPPSSTPTPTPTVTTSAATPTPTQTPTVTPTPTSTPRSGFHTVAPCRIVDTRDAMAPLGGPALAADTTRVFAVLGSCGLPANARAAAFNVTVASATTDGYLTIYPSDSSRPVASTINFRANQTRANNAILRLGSGGHLTVYCGIPTGTVDFVLDVTGYFD